MSRLICSVALSLLLPTVALAEPSPTSKALATELVGLLHMEENFQAYLTQCAKPEGSPFDPMVSFKSDPGSFGGISPQSAYWPEVQSAYARFQQRACAYATPTKFSAYFIDRIADAVEERDLRAAVEFQRSDAAQRVQRAIVSANTGFQAFATKLMYQAYEEANEEFSQDLRKLMRKYRASPK